MWKTILGIVALFAAVVGFTTKYLGLDADSALWVAVPLGLALVAALAWLAVNAGTIARLATSRSARYGINMFALSILVGFIVVMLNVVITTHTTQWDTTSNRRHSLAPQSVSVAEALDEDVMVTANIPRGTGLFDLAPLSEAAFHEQMKMYRAASGHVNYRVIDAVRAPQDAEGLTRPVEPGDIFVQRGERVERVQDYRPTLSDLEEKITRAIIAVTREEKKKIYFLTRDEEALFPEPRRGQFGLQILRLSLEEEQHEVEMIDLLEEQEVPEDCTLLVIADPSHRFTEVDFAALTNFINRGGQVIICSDIEALFQGQVDSPLTEYLHQFGCELGRDVVMASSITDVSFSGRIEFTFSPTFSAGGLNRTHEITSNLRQPIQIQFARSIRTDDLPRGVDGETLLSAGRDAYTTDLESFLRQGPAMPPENLGTESPILATLLNIDVNEHPATFAPRAIPLPEGVTSITPTAEAGEPSETEGQITGGALDEGDDEAEPTVESAEPEDEETEPLPHARILVIGDVTLLTDEFMATGVAGNRDFILNAINHLTEETDLIAIRPRDRINTGFTLSPLQGRLLLVVLILLPLAVAMAGVLVALRRRRLA